MKHLDDEARYFHLAFLAEIAARGRGIQRELAHETGISPSLITDLKNGRTGGSQKKRQALVTALGYTYPDFIARGRMLAEEKLANGDGASAPGGQVQYEQSYLKIKNLRRKVSDLRHRTSALAQKLIIMQERHIGSQERYIAAQDEIMRLRLENENLRCLGRVSENLCGPPVRGGRTAPVIDAE